MLESYIKTCIKDSLSALRSELERYLAVLPLPAISESIAASLPRSFAERRRRLQLAHGLQPDPVLPSLTHSLTPS